MLGEEPQAAALERLARLRLADGARLTLEVTGEDACARGAALLAEAGLLPEHAALVAGPEGGRLRLVALAQRRLPPMRPLRPDEIDQVVEVARRCVFVPKRTWKSDHVHMMRHGLESGRWHPAGIFEAGRLVGYLDYRIRPDGAMEMGFSMTDPDHRRRGHQKRLVTHLTLAHLDRRCGISSSEGNITLKVLGALGYDIHERRPGERLDGTTSVYLTRPARRPFSLRWDGQTQRGREFA